MTAANEPDKAALEQLVRRLSEGEALESVREDFVRDFASVSAREIAEAEQQLINDGMPMREVQRLCDVHSALFHGRTESECAGAGDDDGLPAGHPASVLRAENDAFTALLDEADAAIAGDADTEETHSFLARLAPIRDHYAKKEQLLIPFLHAHGITGPMNVMWGVDDEIARERSSIARKLSPETLDELKPRLAALLARMREMVYKEERIFLPLCLEHLTPDEWFAAYRDLGEYEPSFIDSHPRWLDGDVWSREKQMEAERAMGQGTVRLSTGELSLAQLEAIFKLLPLDLTFIDDGETTRFFTRENKVFARPLSCLGREVWLCHPPELIPMIRKLVEDFKSGKRDSMEVWARIADNPTRTLYVPVRGADGTYLGTLEIVQQFGDMLPKLSEFMS